jgi:two-component system response regulator HydG
VIEAFQKYCWPGNIRELQNIIERMKILAEGSELRLEDVPFSIRYYQAGEERGGAKFSVGMSLEDVERAHILSALEHHHGNKTKTAQSLGITIKTLYNKLHRYGILEPSEPKGASV